MWHWGKWKSGPFRKEVPWPWHWHIGKSPLCRFKAIYQLLYPAAGADQKGCVRIWQRSLSLEANTRSIQEMSVPNQSWGGCHHPVLNWLYQGHKVPHLVPRPPITWGGLRDNIWDFVALVWPILWLLALKEILNITWISGDFPHQWRAVKVIPIPKPNKDHTNPSSYRPIALTSCLCKVLERMINTRFIWYLEKYGILDKSQCVQEAPQHHRPPSKSRKVRPWRFCTEATSSRSIHWFGKGLWDHLAI